VLTLIVSLFVVISFIVDSALKLITQAVENDQQEQLETIVQSIKLRTHQIEEFYTQNEDGNIATFITHHHIFSFL
jgi:hypothetical protein